MKRFNEQGKAHQYWRKWMQSLHCKLSQGSYEITRIIPYAHKDCWRRPDNNKARHEQQKAFHDQRKK